MSILVSTHKPYTTQIYVSNLRQAIELGMYAFSHIECCSSLKAQSSIDTGLRLLSQDKGSYCKGILVLLLRLLSGTFGSELIDFIELCRHMAILIMEHQVSMGLGKLYWLYFKYVILLAASCLYLFNSLYTWGSLYMFSSLFLVLIG